MTAEARTRTAAEVLVASTGRIGVPLPMDRITRGIMAAITRARVPRLQASRSAPNQWTVLLPGKQCR